MTSLWLVHFLAVAMTVVLFGFLIYFNIEQVQEYDYLRKEVDAKLAVLSYDRKKMNTEVNKDFMHLTDIAQEVVGECILELMKEFNEFFLNNGQLLPLGIGQCAPECDCKGLCQLFGKNQKDTAVECRKCRHECNKKFQSEQESGTALWLPKCRYSYTHVNYADSHLGARIVAVQAKPFDCGNFLMCIWGISFGRNPPENILNSNMEPGRCFAFSGIASVSIELSRPIQIDVIEITHIDRCQTPNKDTSSAPKDFTVYGVDSQTGEEILIGDFVFENTVPTELYTYNDDRNKFEIIKIEFKTNHGNPDYTCVYKVGVYGKEVQRNINNF